MNRSLADEQFLSGKGAGRYPTASAVLSDISALRYGYKYEYRKHAKGSDLTPWEKTTAELYVSHPSGQELDTSAFSKIHESFRGQERGYVIGTAVMQDVTETAWWND